MLLYGNMILVVMIYNDMYVYIYIYVTSVSGVICSFITGYRAINSYVVVWKYDFSVMIYNDIYITSLNGVIFPFITGYRAINSYEVVWKYDCSDNDI